MGDLYDPYAPVLKGVGAVVVGCSEILLYMRAIGIGIAMTINEAVSAYDNVPGTGSLCNVPGMSGNIVAEVAPFRAEFA